MSLPESISCSQKLEKQQINWVVKQKGIALAELGVWENNWAHQAVYDILGRVGWGIRMILSIQTIKCFDHFDGEKREVGRNVSSHPKFLLLNGSPSCLGGGPLTD